MGAPGGAQPLVSLAKDHAATSRPAPAPCIVKPEGARRGGARNHADRRSFVIAPATAHALLKAASHAMVIGVPLNRLLTVHWELLGVADAQAAGATTRLLKLIRDALDAHGLLFAYLFVRENDRGSGAKGSHVHILAHIPLTAAKKGLLRRLKAWARLAAGARYNRRTRRIAGAPYTKGATNTRRIGGKAQVAPAVYSGNLAATLVYLLKGVDAETAGALGLPRHEEGGTIIGKRCGWSENLGQSARRRWQARPH